MFQNIYEKSTSTYFAICLPCKLLEISQIDFYVVQCILENLTETDYFSNFATAVSSYKEPF